MTEADTVNETFDPLGVREGWTSNYGPFEGVPAHLMQSLLDWVSSIFYRQWRSASSVQWNYSFRFDLLQRAERQVRFASGIIRGKSHEYEARNKLRAFLEKNSRTFLGLIDFLLWVDDVDVNEKELSLLLTQGGSVYHVVETSGRQRLQRRVEPHLDALARDEMKAGGDPGELLDHAWSATFGIDPNPSHGYRTAVRAVEAAAIPIVLPSDTDATLGKVIGHLAATRDRWTFVLPQRRDGEPSVQTLIDNMGMLWTSHYDRHVTQGVPLHIGQHEADAALPLAALLVHWLRSDALRKAV